MLVCVLDRSRSGIRSVVTLPEGSACPRVVQGSNDVAMKTVGAIAAAQIALMPLAGVQHITKLVHAALLSEANLFHICIQT